ncbi:MAG: Holliday junction resolvase RuvX [Chitinispirillaceae bacterium]|nr:Holliday junction resolvase RuvX [Chitinispirillaceae bacterium]
MKLMGVDYGRRRIGLSVGDEAGVALRGLPTIDRKNNPGFFSKLLEIIDREKPDALVFGLPLDGDDAETVMSTEVRTFAAKTARRAGLPVFFIDESLSSLRAAALLRYQGKKKRRDKGSVDRLAACIILDRFIREHGCA